MKKRLYLLQALLLSMIMMFGISLDAFAEEDEPKLVSYDVNGDGVTENDEKAYKITNADELYWFAKAADGNRIINAFLANNITVNTNLLTELITVSDDGNGTLTVLEGENVRKWKPICNYSGTFDGKGHSVSGLYFNEEVGFIGMFRSINGGNVKNVGVVDSCFHGSDYIGGICGVNEEGTIENCYSTGVFFGNGYIGGICGYNEEGTIENCYSTGGVFGSAFVGEIRGYSYEGTITNCYYLDGMQIAGGHDDEGIEPKREEAFKSGEVCWLLNGGETQVETPRFFQNIGVEDYPVTDRTHHAVVKDGDKYIFKHNYINGFCTGCDGYEAAESVPDTEDIDGDTNIEECCYKISNAGQLYWFAGLVNGTLEGVVKNSSANAFLANDITVNKNLLTELITVADDGTAKVNEMNIVREWTPIGNSGQKYYGTFDGNGHSVSGLYFNNDDVQKVGLFGCLESGSRVMNLTVADSYICGDEKVGGVCGLNKGIIQNCSNMGSITGTNYIGGVCGDYGYNTTSKIQNCSNTGAVTGTNWIGGICGIIYSNYTVKIGYCYNTGTISGSDYVGGICGQKPNVDSILITNCYNAGSVLADDNKDIGSITPGRFPSTVKGCYYLETCGKDLVATPMSAEQFASGKVCYLLNGDETQAEEPQFFQNIGEDELPVLDKTHTRVYLTSGKCIIYSNTVSDNKLHSLKSCGKKDATCEAAGLKEYWQCEDCGLYFSNEAGTEEIKNLESWLTGEGVIGAKGHDATMIPQVDSTVTKYGLMAYWYCKDCNKYFLDEDCKDEIVNFEEWKNGQGRIEKKKTPNPDTNPTPNPGPDTNPTPNPDPNPTPNPDPNPTSNPGPDTNPTPNPDPNPTPNPDPNPTPNPGPTPNPEPDVKPVAIGGQKLNVSNMFVSMLKDGEKIVSFSIKDKKEKKLASVNKKGEVNPKKTGVIHITAYKKEGKNKNEIGTVELSIVVPTFDKKAMKANFEGQTVSGNLLLSDYELASKNQTVVWKSSKTTVATVDENTGLITALKSGKTTISVKFMNSEGKSVTKKATFTVKIPKLNVKDTITLKNGKTKKLSLSKIEKTDVVTWSSSDASIVSIEPNKNKAVIKANSTGTAEITATVNGHSYKTIVNVP